MGIGQVELSRLCEWYYWVENNNYISGFEIGLYLSAEVIERHKVKFGEKANLAKVRPFILIYHWINKLLISL